MNQKDLSPILIIVLITLIALGGYAVWQNQTKSTPQSTIQPSPTPAEETVYTEATESANWKTYTSEDKSFSFKYPPEWIYEIKETILEVGDKKYNAHLIKAGIPLTEERRKIQGYLDINDAPKTFNDFSLLYATSPDFKNLTLDNLVEDFILKFTVEENIDHTKDILFSNKVTAREVGYGCQAYCIDIVFRNNDTIFDSSTGPNADANIDTLRQIISTFKFLGPSQVDTIYKEPDLLLTCQDFTKIQGSIPSNLQWGYEYCQGYWCAESKSKVECESAQNDMVKIENNKIVAGEDGTSDCQWDNSSSTCKPNR